MRSSTFKESTDFKNKSFKKFGTIAAISEQEFKASSKKQIGEALVKNPNIKLQDDNWVYTENERKEVITQHENISTETGPLANEYVGQSPYLNLEVFKETSDGVADSFYSFYSIKNAVMFELVQKATRRFFLLRAGLHTSHPIMMWEVILLLLNTCRKLKNRTIFYT
ncbi:hypothetical protein [Chryseobacterium sp. NFX27]|uniref:hypothetical protein n=1 Tax=Chryseobacterium sp. NFX27 TaxID=2819618 RepID=UPI003CEC2637